MKKLVRRKSFLKMFSFLLCFHGFLVAEANSDFENTKSVAMTGYSADRTSKAEVPFLPQAIRHLKSLPFVAGKTATKYMPLFINGKDLNNHDPKIRNLRLLVFSTNEKEVVFWDLVTNRLYWKSEPAPFWLIKSGAYSQRFKKIFFHGEGGILELDPLAKSQKFLPLIQTEFLTDKIEGYDSRALLNFNPCNTSLGIADAVEKPFLFWGCSTPARYGELQGLTGSVFKWPMDPSTGTLLDKKEVRVFHTSKIVKDLEPSGYNSGVWNSGMGPTFIAPQQLFVSTGNGPNFPKKENYGCSVLRLNTETWQLDASRGPKDNSYEALAKEDFQECLPENLDASSGSLATLQMGERQIGVLASSDQNIRVLDLQNLSGSNENLFQRRLISERAVFGTTIALETKNNEADFYFWSYNPREQTNLIIGPADLPQKIQFANLQKISEDCIGWSSSKTQKSQLNLQLYYSGYFLNSSFWLESAFQHEYGLNSFRKPDLPSNSQSDVFWSNYSKQSPTLHLARAEAVADGFQAADINLYSRGRYGWFTSFEQLNNKLTLPSMKKLSTRPLAQILISKDEKSLCGTAKQQASQRDLGYEPLYVYTVEQKNKIGRWNPKTTWKLNSFHLQKNLEISENWVFNGQPNETAPHSSFVLGTHGIEGFAVLPISKQGKKSVLKLVNLKSGKLLTQQEFNGDMHFSQPLLLGNSIFLPTLKNGIQRLEIQLKK